MKYDNAHPVEYLLAGRIINSSMVELHLLYYLLCKNWKVRICHVSTRAHNEVTDNIVKYVNSDFMNLCVFDESSLSVQILLLTDCNSPSWI